MSHSKICLLSNITEKFYINNPTSMHHYTLMQNNYFASLLKILRITFGLVIKLSNSIQQFHGLHILLKTITPFLFHPMIVLSLRTAIKGHPYDFLNFILHGMDPTIHFSLQTPSVCFFKDKECFKFFLL